MVQNSSNPADPYQSSTCATQWSSLLGSRTQAGGGYIYAVMEFPCGFNSMVSTQG